MARYSVGRSSAREFGSIVRKRCRTMVPAGIAQRSHSGEPMGSVTPMTAGTDAEVAQVPGRATPRRADPLDERAGRSALHRLEQRFEVAAPALRHAPDRTVRF